MKKLITLVIVLGMAGLFNSAFSQGNTDNADASATATVLEDVTVTQVTDLAFGEVFQGNSSSVASSSGASFDVSGDDSKNVTLDFTLPNEGSGPSPTNGYTYWLDGPSSSELEITFSATDANWESGTTHSASNTFDPASTTSASLSTDGDVRVWIGGTVNPLAGQTTGSYTGTITLTATYN